MNALEKLIDRFQNEQGWNDGTVCELLKRFLWKHKSKSMLADLESEFNEVASIENEISVE